MSQTLTIIIVDKSATLKALTVKQFNPEELFKKCGFKKADDFVTQVEWKLKTNGNKYLISVFGKTEGRANNENKYDFPPPIDSKLFFGNCAIIAKIGNAEGLWEYTNLSLELWEKMYEKLLSSFSYKIPFFSIYLQATDSQPQQTNTSFEKVAYTMYQVIFF